MAFPLALIPIIASVAPALVRLATGSDRAGRIAEAATDIVAEVTGAPVRAPDGAARAAERLQADPALMAELTRRLADLEQRELEAVFADRADARARDVEVRRVSGGENRRADQLLWAIVALLVAVLAANVAIGVWVTQEGPHLTAAVGLLGTAAGFLLRGLSSALDFEFGSSRGSKDKDQALAALTAGPPPTPIAGPLRSMR